MKHTMEIPDSIWNWAIEESGLKNPQPWIREKLHELHYSEATNKKPQLLDSDSVGEPEFDNLWEDLGIDPRFESCLLRQFIQIFEDQDEALNYWRKQNIDSMRNPAAVMQGFVNKNA